MSNSVQMLFNTFDLNIGKFSIPVPYWEAISIVFLLFLLVMVLAQMRKHYVDWSLKGGVAGIFFGFLLALILEGFVLLGGRTALTSFLGWKNPPAPLSHMLDAGKTQLIQVLGINTQIPSSYAKESISTQEAIQIIQSLAPGDIKKVKNILCSQ